MKLIDYVPAWPSYRATRLCDAVLSDGEHSWRLDEHDLCAYRLRTWVNGVQLTIIVSVPAGFDEPLADRQVVAMVQQAVEEAIVQ